MQFICYWNFNAKNIYIYPKSSPPSRARALMSLYEQHPAYLCSCLHQICVEINLHSDSSGFARPSSPPTSGEYFFKAECERVAWSAPLQTLLHLNRVMRVDTSGFWEPYRLHSSFIGVTRSWTLARADRETDLHRDLLAPRLYLENPVRAPAASR